MTKSIVVAGDVCVDWLSIPLDPASLARGPKPAANWQLFGGRRMYARHGGAWLTTWLTRRCIRATPKAKRPAVEVYGPQRFSQRVLDSISPDDLIHSLLTLDRCQRESDDNVGDKKARNE